MTRVRSLLLILVCLGVVGTASLSAQTPDPIFDARGINQNRAYFSQLPFENVDAVTGALVLTFTDLVLPGNASSELRLQRTFNSKPSDPSRAWTFGVAGMVMEIRYPGPPPETNWPNPPGERPFPDPVDADYRPVFYRADGGVQSTIWAQKPVIHDPTSYRWVTTSDFLRYDTVERRLYLPDGTVCQYGDPAPGRTVKLEEIRDRFGNVTLLDWDANGHLVTIAQHLSDTQMRVVTFEPSDPLAIDQHLPSKMTFGDREWTYAYSGEGLTQATGPVGPSWTYEYGSETMAVVSPQGGRVEYDFESHAFPDYAVPPSPTPGVHISSVVKTRRTRGRLPAGDWHYAYDSGAQRTTIAGPGDVVTTIVYQFRSGALLGTLGGGLVPIIRTVRQGNVVLEHETSEYEELQVVSGLMGGGVPAITRTRIKRGAADDQSKTTYETTYEYRGLNDHFSDYHRPVTIRESGDKSRVITRSYNYSLHSDILGKLASETITSGAESFTKTWAYESSTGFVTNRSVYGIVKTYGRDARGNVTSVTDASGTTSYEYDWGVPSAIITPKYRVNRSVAADGTITSQTEAGRTTTYGYDTLQRPTRVTPPLGLPVATLYDNVGGAWIRVEQGATWTRTDVDGAGRTIGSTDAVGAKAEIVYDAEGRTIGQSLPFDAQHPKQMITNAYDGLGRLVERRHPDNSRLAYAYDGINITITDEQDRVTRQYFEAFGNPADTRLVAVVDADDKRWEYRYNVLGLLTKVTAPDGNANTTREWAYNGKALLTAETHPESGETRYEHDLAGNVTAKTDAAGVRLDFQYDQNNRLTRVTGPNGQWTSIEYETGSGNAGSDRRTFISRGGQISSRFSYDLAGRLSWREDTIDGKTFRTEQDYDDLGNIDELTYPDQRLIKYRYDLANRITRIEDLSNGTKTYASNFAYHPSGALESYRAGNDVVTTIAYDAKRLWPESISAVLPAPGAVGLSLDYDYDPSGNIRSITEPARSGANYSQTFQYDALDRLTRAEGIYGTQIFTYDTHGSQLASNRTYDFNKLRLTSSAGVTFGYDNAGRLTNRLAETFTYNMTGMMTRAALHGRTVDYDYDPDELRKVRREMVGGIEERSFFVHGLGTMLLSEFQQKGSGTVQPLRDYIYAGSRLIAVAKPRRTNIEFAAAEQRLDEPANPANPADPGIPRQGRAELVLRLPGGGQLAHDVVVSYAVTGGLSVDGRATQGRDYSVAAATGTITFGAGAVDGASREILFQILHDRKDEADETFEVTITGISDPDVVVGNAAVHTVTIADNDEPPVANLSADVTVVEGPAQVTLTVTLSEASGRTVSVNAFTTPQTASLCAYFVAKAQTLTFLEDETTKSFTVSLVDNAKGNEPLKRFYVDLDTPVHVTLGRARATVTVQDDPAEAVASLAWPGVYLANVRAAGRRDYVLIANPFGRAIDTTITMVFDDGSAWRHTRTIAPFARYTLDLGGAETACEPAASIAVQVQNGDVPGVEHAGYMGDAGGVSVEGVRLAPKWFFAEGHTGFGKELIDVFNPNAFPVSVSITLYGGTGQLVANSYVMAPLSRAQWPLNGWTPSTAHGTAVRATVVGGTNPVSIVATRTILADPQFGWSSSTDGHATPGTSVTFDKAYLAEGHHGGALKTYLALMSAADTPTTVRVAYLHENGAVYNTDVALPARARITVEPPASMPGGGFGYRLSTTPATALVAERVMYTLPGFSAGHAGVAVAAPSGVREFAEGATGPFETHFLVANPSETKDARLLFEFSDETGTAYLRHEAFVPANSRRDINVSNLPGMAERIFHTNVSGSIPVVTERVSYWPSRAILSVFSAMLQPFTPAASMLATPRPWTPPAEATVASPYPLTPSTLVGPEWSPENLAAAQSQTLESLNVMTSLTSGDAWLAAHLSGGVEISAAPRLGVATIATPASSVLEGGVATVDIRVTTEDGAPLGREVTVYYATATAMGTFPATAGLDYTPTSGSVTFPIGWTSGLPKAVTIATIDNALQEYEEPFRLLLTSVAGGAVLGTASTHTITIFDNDPDPQLRVNDVSVDEINSVNGTATQAVFTVSLTPASERWVAVTAKTTNGTATGGLDFDHYTQAVTFPPGTTSMTFVVPIRDDDKSDPGEVFYVDLSAPIHATITRARGTGTIVDNEPPRVPINTTLPGQYFPDVVTSPDTSAYIMISNPHPVAVTARLTFTRPNASGVTRDVVVQASRRLSIDLGGEPGIAGLGEVSVAVQTTNATYPLVSEVSHYWQADWRGGRNTHGGTPSPVVFFAEGAANSFFEEYITIYNVTNGPIDVALRLMKESGGLQSFSYRIQEGPGRLKIRVTDLLPDVAHGTVIEAYTLAGAPTNIVAERTMYWAGGDRREGHSATGSNVRSYNWYFAEGATGAFSTYLALTNYEPSASQVTIRYIHENGVTYTQTATVPSYGRVTVQPPAAVPGGGFAMAMTATNNVPFIAERTMYSGTDWKTGASETGSHALSTRWHFAEGASNGYFASWLLLFNPNLGAANGTLTFRLENGQVITAPFSVPGNSRIALPLASIASLNGQTFATEVAVANGAPIVAERVMYWPAAWAASHASAGRAW